MESISKYMFTLTVFWGYFTNVDSFPLFEFQYPCFVPDVCTHPNQFCSSSLKRCLDCKYECSKPGELVLACKEFCYRANFREEEEHVKFNLHEAWFPVSLVFIFLFVGLGVFVSMLYKRGCMRLTCIGIEGNSEGSDTEKTSLMPEMKQGINPENGLVSLDSNGTSIVGSPIIELPPPNAECKGETATCYGEKKLKNVIPTQGLSPSNSKPTVVTTLTTLNEESSTHTLGADMHTQPSSI